MHQNVVEDESKPSVSVTVCVAQAAYGALIVPATHHGRIEELFTDTWLSEARSGGQGLLDLAGAQAQALTRGASVLVVERPGMLEHARVAVIFRY